MKKKQFFYTFAAGIFAAAILAGGLVSSPTLVSADEEPTAEATDASNNPPRQQCQPASDPSGKRRLLCSAGFLL